MSLGGAGVSLPRTLQEKTVRFFPAMYKRALPSFAWLVAGLRTADFLHFCLSMVTQKTPLRRMGGFRNTPPARRSVASVAPAFQGGLGAVSQGCLSSKKISARCLVRAENFFDPLTAARPPYLARQTEAARRAGVFRAFHTPPAQREGAF